MFKTFINAFKVKDVRRKIFYVLMMLVVIRLGSQMPVPGVNTSFFANYFANNTNEAFSFLNAFTVHYFFHHYSAAHHCNSTT